MSDQEEEQGWEEEAEDKLPPPVSAFCLVGRIAIHPETQLRGVVKFVFQTFGSGKQHVGFPCYYRRATGTGKDRKYKYSDRVMDTDFLYTIEWQDGTSEELSLEQVQLCVTQEWTDEEWLPAPIRKLHEEGWGSAWDALDGDNIVDFQKRTTKEAEKAAAAKHAKKAKLAKQGKQGDDEAGPSGSRKPEAAAGKKKGCGCRALSQAVVRPAAGLISAIAAAPANSRGKEPLGKFAPSFGQDLLEVQARKRALAAQAALTASGSAAAQPAASRSTAAPAATAAPAKPAGPAAKKPRQLHQASVARHTAAQPAAVAAALVPSGGQGSPIEDRLDHADSNAALLAAGPPSGKRQRQADATEQAEHKRQRPPATESAVAGTAGKQAAAAPEAVGSKPKASTAAAPRTAAAPKPAAPHASPLRGVGNKQQQRLTTPRASKSMPGSRSAQNSGSRHRGLEPVLRQHEQAPVAPRDSHRLARAEWQHDYGQVTCVGKGNSANGPAAVFWFDRVQAEDGTIFRVYSESLVMPESMCFKHGNKRLRTWKPVDEGDDANFVVEAVLAEREEEDGSVEYLAKWQGYEADPANDSWLAVSGMKDCQEVRKEWRNKGRAEWLEACRMLKEEAGLE